MGNFGRGKPDAGKHVGRTKPIIVFVLLCLMVLALVIFRDQLHAFLEQLTPIPGGLAENTVLTEF